ncbi:MFS transporter [Hydrogenophaga sp.]|uniref:MFS transporter n=1 Tax=Hydrogenophaga sp. TaxID=1904254 RepID=UPI00271A32C0|nr:MFS transporter [Hydrogenophaga sp.]MDO9438808.1 MFS transporter [Hydrogenophaga sp.]
MVLGIALSVMDSSILNLALPDIARELDATATQAIWVVNAYQIASLVMLLPLAALGDRLGYRRVYLVGMALFALSSIAAMLANSLPMLIAARALQGLGAAGVMSVNTALVRLIYPSNRLGRGMALNSMVVATSTMAGPAVAAGILSFASWHWLFAMNVPLGLLIVWMGRRALPFNPHSENTPSRFSWLDVALNVLMFTLVFVGGEQLSVRAGNASLGAMLLVAGLLVGVFYVRRQWHQVTPMFPVDLLRIPVFALSMGSSLGAFCAQMLAFLCLPFLLLEVHGRTHLEAGLLLTAWPIASVVVAPIAGRLIGRFPAGWLGAIGMVVFASGLLLLALLPDHASSANVAWRMALCGAGFALFQSPNNHTIVTSAPLHRSGAASGMVGTARLTGQTFGAVVLAVVYAIWNQHDGKGETIALCVAAGSALLAGLTSSLRVRAAR